MRYADGGGLTAAGRCRRQAVRRQAAELSEQEIKPLEVAQRLRVSRKSAYRCHQLWRDGGIEALASRGPSGSRSRLSPHCLEKLAAYLAEGPTAHGWVEDQVWTAARVTTLISRKFHPTRIHPGRDGQPTGARDGCRWPGRSRTRRARASAAA
ncbi:helix-turn-helix domain-containing protein [Streptomyces sp. OE57]|uniref:helix-turn-helix domain-containing protein n=1 Tax=Streptomyces lacaronensis TaxID=3379885 RepID=UPI0039B769CC